MDTGFVTREQDRLLGELFTFLRIPSVSTLPQNAGDCRRAADWLMTEFKRLKCAEGRTPRRERASRSCGRRARECPASRRCWSTDTTTCSRPIRSTSGCRRRSSRPSATASSSPAAPRTTRARCTASSRPTRRSSTPIGKPPLNVNFIIEGEEECGGDVIVDRLKREPERTRGRRRAGGGHVLLRPRLPAGVHRAPGHVLRGDPPAHARARSPLRDLRRRRAERARDARPPAVPDLKKASTAGSISPGSTTGRGAHAGRS